MLEQLLDRCLLHHFTRVHHPDPLTDPGDYAQIVADVHNGCVELSTQFADEIENSRLNGHIQGRSRLVHKQQGWVIEKGHGDDHPLLLAAGYLMGIALHHSGRVWHIDPFQHHNGALFRLRSTDPLMYREDLLELIPQTHGRIQCLHWVLVYHCNLIPLQAPSVFPRPLYEVLALEEDLSAFDIAICAQIVDDGPGKGAFAAAGFADNAEGFAPVDGK